MNSRNKKKHRRKIGEIGEDRMKKRKRKIESEITGRKVVNSRQGE